MFFLDAFRNCKYPYRNNIKIYFFTCRYYFVIRTQNTKLIVRQTLSPCMYMIENKIIGI